MNQDDGRYDPDDVHDDDFNDASNMVKNIPELSRRQANQGITLAAVTNNKDCMIDNRGMIKVDH